MKNTAWRGQMNKEVKRAMRKILFLLMVNGLVFSTTAFSSEEYQLSGVFIETGEKYTGNITQTLNYVSVSTKSGVVCHGGIAGTHSRQAILHANCSDGRQIRFDFSSSEGALHGSAEFSVTGDDPYKTTEISLHIE